MGVSTNSESVDFTGGMNTVTARHLIAPSEAIALINVDIRNGSLLSMPELKRVIPANGSHFVEFRDRPYYYDSFRANAFMDNNMYWANGKETGKVLWDGRKLPLGIPTPTIPLSLASAGNTPSGTHTGDFKYTYTFYSTDTGVESAPAPLPPYLTVDLEDIVLDGFEPFPVDTEGEPIADTYRLYRIGGYLPTFTLVEQITTLQIPYTDVLDDTEIDGRILYTIRSGPPIPQLNDLVELNGRLFGSVGTKVYYSALGNPDAWYGYDFFTMPDRITGMAKSPGGLIVFGVTFTYLLAGDGPTSFRLKVISNKLGCVARESIAYLRDSVIWLGTTGILSSNGYRITNLTADKIANIDNLKATSACVVNEVYYLHFQPILVPSNSLFPSDTLYPLSSVGTDILESGIVSMDFKRGNLYSYNLYDYSEMSSIGIIRGDVHVITGDGSYVGMDCNQPLSCEDYIKCTRYDLNILGTYDSRQFTELTYASPQFIDGSLATLKQYDKVRINMWGEFTVKVLFSDGTIAVEEKIVNKPPETLIALLNAGDIEYSEDNTVTIGIPNNNNNSYSIAFVIQGKGVVKSIQYSWKNREQP